jgi:hypothetical protein
MFITRRHQLIHQPPSLFCQYDGCGRAFHRPDLLARHHKRQYEIPGLTPFLDILLTGASEMTEEVQAAASALVGLEPVPSFPLFQQERRGDESNQEMNDQGSSGSGESEDDDDEEDDCDGDDGVMYSSQPGLGGYDGGYQGVRQAGPIGYNSGYEKVGHGGPGGYNARFVEDEDQEE